MFHFLMFFSTESVSGCASCPPEHKTGRTNSKQGNTFPLPIYLTTLHLIFCSQQREQTPMCKATEVLHISLQENGTEGYLTLQFDRNTDLLFFPNHFKCPPIEAALHQITCMCTHTENNRMLLTME